MTEDIHAAARVLQAGADPLEAKGAVILIHGRGATADSIPGLAGALERPDFFYLAPQAAGNTWYPNRFMVPRAQNEPNLSSALALVGRLVDQLASVDIPPEKIAIVGFSQGACLAADFAARNARRYGGIGVLSGGLIGDAINPADYPGSLSDTPVFVGCSDIDGHIPLERVKLTSKVLGGMGAALTERIYPGMGHSVNDNEIEALQEMLDGIGK